MASRSDLHFRKHLRLRGFDYRDNHAYCVTICTRNRQCVLGSVLNDAMSLSRRGVAVQDCWRDIPNHHPHVELDAFVVMPNHVHGILLFVGDAGAHTTQDRRTSFALGAASGSLGAVVGSFKSAASRTINQLRRGAGTGIWQPNYYEHIIRNDLTRDRIRDYIDTNPMRWGHDAENPEGDGTDRLEAFVKSLEESPLRGDRDAGVAATGRRVDRS